MPDSPSAIQIVTALVFTLCPALSDGAISLQDCFEQTYDVFAENRAGDDSYRDVNRKVELQFHNSCDHPIYWRMCVAKTAPDLSDTVEVIDGKLDPLERSESAFLVEPSHRITYEIALSRRPEALPAEIECPNYACKVQRTGIVGIREQRATLIRRAVELAVECANSPANRSSCRKQSTELDEEKVKLSEETDRLEKVLRDQCGYLDLRP